MIHACRVFVAAAGVALAMLTPMVSAGAAPARGDTLRLTSEGLSADLVDAPLGRVLETIARETHVRIVTDIADTARVTARFDAVPLEEALRRLLGSDALVFLYTPDAFGRAAEHARLAEVRAYGSSTRRGDEPLASAQTEVGDDGAVTGAGVHRAAAEADADTQLVDALTGALDDDDPVVRERAATALGRTWSEQSVIPLSRALSDDDAEVREAAAHAMGRIWVDAAVTILSDVLINDPARVVREAAAEALGDTQSVEALTALRAAVRDEEDPWVREEARAAIAHLTKRGVPRR